MLNIDLLQFKEKMNFRIINGKKYLFGVIRKKYLVIQPEELVRQLIIHYLANEKGYNQNRIAVEKQLIVNELRKRCDILIYDEKFTPWLLIECKAPSVSIDEKTFRQIAWYNMPLKVPFLMVSNGIHSYCCKMDYENESYQFLKEVPDFQ